MTNKINETLIPILEIFKSGQIPEAVSYAAFPSFDIPSEQWSYLNRIIMWLNGTYDARGYRQWEEVGRHVKKGATAFHIFAPRLVKEKKENGEEDFSLLGFLQVPVFCYEDTEGEPLNYKKTEINSFHLIEKAEEWGLDVHAVSGNDRYWGAYNGKEIKLATPEEASFSMNYRTTPINWLSANSNPARTGNKRLWRNCQPKPYQGFSGLRQLLAILINTLRATQLKQGYRPLRPVCKFSATPKRF